MNLKNEIENEHKQLTKLIFQGKTITQIAQEMNYSRATASNHIYALYEKYEAKNRLEFVINVLAKVIQKYKASELGFEAEIQTLKDKINELNKILKNKT